MWRTRPVRRSDDRKIAGVAAGIARRYDLDPTLVRVVLVVTSFYGGCGILIYLLGWLFLRQQNELSSPAEALAGRGRRTATLLGAIMLPALLVMAIIPIMGWVLSNAFTSAVCLGGVGVALYLLHVQRRDTGQPTVNWPQTAHVVDDFHSAAEAPTTAFGTPAAAPFTPESEVGYPTDRFPGSPTAGTAQQRAGEPEPPAWDPLGVAPFAWQLPDPVDHRAPAPEPEPAPAPTRRVRSRVTPITIGAALLTFAIGMPLLESAGWLTQPRMLALILAVLGIGMVVGAFRSGGRGLIWVSAPIAAVAMLVSLVPIHETGGWLDAGSTHLRVSEPEQLRDAYRRSLGAIELDLTELTIPEGETLRTEVMLNLGGNIEVIVPPDMAVSATCQVRLGGMSCLGEENYGENEQIHVADRPDGPDSAGGTLELDAYLGLGELNVTRR